MDKFRKLSHKYMYKPPNIYFHAKSLNFKRGKMNGYIQYNLYQILSMICCVNTILRIKRTLLYVISYVLYSLCSHFLSSYKILSYLPTMYVLSVNAHVWSEIFYFYLPEWVLYPRIKEIIFFGSTCHCSLLSQ